MEQLDVAVVGGGIAGLSAAVRASELGLKVALFEKGSEGYLCNTRYTGGIYHVGQQLVDAPAEQLVNRINSVTGGGVDPELVQTTAAEFARAVGWLRTQGIKFMKAPNDANEAALVVAPPRPIRAGVTFAKGYGGDAMIATLTKVIHQNGGQVFLDSRAVELTVTDGVCTGLKIVTAGAERQISARAVVLADGGYQANMEMIAAHIGRGATRIFQRNAGSGTGDGLTMAMTAGAAAAGLNHGFYGHLLAVDVFQIPDLWPYPIIDRPATSGIVVGPDGKRIADEGRGAVYLSNVLGQLDDPQSGIAIFDHSIWTTDGKALVVPVDPWLERVGGTVFRGNSIAELAGQLGIDPAALVATVQDYNQALAAGRLDTLTPKRGTAPRAAFPIATGPFYAIRIVPGMTYTMGGIATDSHGRVKREDGSIFKGLFAAGATTGGLEGGPNFGYVGGLSKSTIFGMRAAEFIAQDLRA